MLELLVDITVADHEGSRSESKITCFQQSLTYQQKDWKKDCWPMGWNL
jgi:hypothetical protein